MQGKNWLHQIIHICIIEIERNQQNYAIKARQKFTGKLLVD